MHKKITDLHPHPLNERLYGQEELPEPFLVSVRKKGILAPLAVKEDGTIISGHRRLQAALATGLEFVPVEIVHYENELDEREAIIEFNRQREKTFSQKMAEAEELKAVESERARLRQAHGQTAPGKNACGNVSTSDNGKTRDKVAATIGIGSGRTYEKAAKVWEAAKSGDETAKKAVAELDAGRTTIHAAIKTIERESRARELQATALPEGKYRVIYADPPWKYGNSMPAYYGEQADHYSLMTVEEICQMPVKQMAADNAILFLWATSPILEESFQVIAAWGFRYKASFVWDKVRHVMGHYNSVRHEFLLLATRGSCQPDVKKLFDSVQSIESTKHSEKPEEFREIIDTIYPHGPRVELFARKKVEGWVCHGNEIPALVS